MSITGTTEREVSTLGHEPATWREYAHVLAVLFKSRVVSLLLMSAIGGAFLGAGGWPGLGSLALVLIAGGLAASGAAGLNEYLERGTDAVMKRTVRRPLVTGRIPYSWVIWASSLMILVPSLGLLPFKPALSIFLLAGAFIYVGLYTIILKPRTPLNIVIGGAAGSAAVMSGGAAAGNWQDPAVITLALLLFLWTPCHFWSLAILYREDYGRARLPMLPAQISVHNSAWWVLLHTGATGFAAIMLAFTPKLGWLYLLPVVAATTDMYARNVRLIKDSTPANARALFISSNLYLLLVLVSICVGTVIHSVWPPL